MTVTQIAASANRAGRYAVTFSDGTVHKLLPEVIGDFGLYPGLALSEEEMEALLKAGRAADTRLRAVRIISATTVSGRDLEERLRHKGADPEDAANTVQWLQELNLLDDAQAARQIVARGVRRGYGERRIRQMLYEKKIPRSLWEEALSELPPMDAVVDDFLREHLQDQPEEKVRRRTVDALIRRGFSWEEIREGLRRYDHALADEMEDM